MTALQAHVTSEDHAGLVFHPGCPVCRRERLSGPLPACAIVGPRARALLAAGVLAGSTGASGAAPALAQTPEEAELGGLLDQMEGVPLTPEEQAQMDADAAAPEDPLEAEDAPDPLPPEPPADPVPPAEIPAAQPPAAQAPTPQPRPAPVPRAPAAENERPAPRPEPEPEPESPGPRPAERPAVQVAPVDAPTPRAAPATAASAYAAPAPTSGASHVVQSGESLWSIARDLLGPRATSARIATEVARIWSLNAGAIGTGDPDLVLAGQRLRLPGHD